MENKTKYILLTHGFNHLIVKEITFEKWKSKQKEKIFDYEKWESISDNIHNKNIFI